MRPSAAHARPAVPFRDGWAALCLGAVAAGYLLLVLALTAVALVPLALGWQGSVVQSGSMRPHIEAGDVVLSTALPDDRPVPLGGVVEFRSPAAAEPSGEDRLRLHRIVAEGENPGEWVTAGDANAEPDSTPVTREDITGQARLLVPWIGLPSLWIGEGRLVPLALWLGGTAVALGLALWWWSGVVRSRADAGTGENGPPEVTENGAADGPRDVSRRSALLAVAVLTLGGAAATLTGERAYAGFSARTVNARSTFRVATWPTTSLGRAASYAVIAGTAVVNESFLGIGSSVRGSIAVTPGTVVRGFWPWDITGDTDRNTPVARNAAADATALLDALLARPTGTTLPATVTGVLSPGTYRRTGALQVRDTLTLDAHGDPSAVFVITATSLSFAQRATVVLRGGASPDRIFFVSTSSLTAAADVQARGVLIARDDITLDRAALTGRAFALRGTVTLSRATVTAPGQ
jgi:signal peptidase I